MVFGLLKNSCKRMIMTRLCQQKLTILSIAQKGYRLDFVHKVEGTSVSCLFDLTHILHPGAFIKSVDYQSGDRTVLLDKLLVAKKNFMVTVSGGKPDSKSTLLFKISTDSGFQQEFTVLLDVISQKKKEFNEKHHLRMVQLWGVDRNPDRGYRQEYGTGWIEGDMVLNCDTLQLWQYCPGENPEWLSVCQLKGVVKPVSIPYKMADSSGDVHPDSQDEKQRTISKENVNIQGDITAQKIRSRAIISGDPLGKGILITTDGMISGQSLYIGSEQEKPKNMFVGCNGIISTRHLSADSLQLFLFSVKELPGNVAVGTLVLCRDYPNHVQPVLICAMKNNPESLSDWRLLYESGFSAPEGKTVIKPPLSVVTSDSKRDIDMNKVVEIRPSLLNHVDRKKEGLSRSESADPNRCYIRLVTDLISVQASEQERLNWDHVHFRETALRVVSTMWKYENQCWQVPATGLLQINGWLNFAEKDIDLTGPIPYHAGDMFYLDIIRNSEENVPAFLTNQMEFPMVPYINDITNKVCPNQRIGFSCSFPVRTGDELIFKLAYFHQKDPFGYKTSLEIHKAVFELSIF